MGTLDSGSSMDPRYSSAFQRGGEQQFPRFSSSSSASPVDPWAFNGGEGVRDVSPSGNRPPGGDGGAADSQLEARDSVPPAALSLAAGPVPPEALRYLKLWGWALTVGSSGALVLVVFAQQAMNGAVYANNDLQWFWAVQSVVVSASPWLLVLGLGCLIFSGYRARAARRPVVEESS
jgi:hypothetical protein